MRVVVFSRHFPEYCYRYALGLARYADVLLILDRQNAANEFDPATMPSAPRLKIKYTVLHPKRNLFALLNAIRVTLAFRPEFVHFQEIPDAITPLVMTFVSQFTRTAVTIHDPKPHSGGDSSRPSYIFRLARFGREVADLVVVHGGYCRNVLETEYPRLAGKIVRSDHGIFMPPASPFTERDLRSILLFGRMEAYKGLAVLLAASDILTSRGIQHKVIVAGRGAEADRLAVEMARRPAFKVHNRYVHHSEAAALFQHCGIVVLPYLDATQSGVAAAAMANGRPVVASSVGGLNDIIKDTENGLLVQPGDAKQLADAMAWILEDEDRLHALSKGALLTANTIMDWNRIAQEMASEFEKHYQKT